MQKYVGETHEYITTNIIRSSSSTTRTLLILSGLGKIAIVSSLVSWRVRDCRGIHLNISLKLEYLLVDEYFIEFSFEMRGIPSKNYVIRFLLMFSLE